MKTWKIRKARKEIIRAEKINRNRAEGRGEWWCMPLWKKILFCIIFPFVAGWLYFCKAIMWFGKLIYLFGDLLSGFSLNNGNWLEDV